MSYDANRAVFTVHRETVPLLRDSLVTLFFDAESWTCVGTDAERADHLRDVVAEILSEWLRTD
mgnify:CR=1 FL=1